MKRYYLKLSPKSQLGYDAPPLKEWVKRNGYQFKYANNVLTGNSDELLLYYGYSNEKAKQALTLLTKEHIAFIKSKFETGGTK